MKTENKKCLNLLASFREEFYIGQGSGAHAVCAKNLWNGKGCAMIAKRMGARENLLIFSRSFVAIEEILHFRVHRATAFSLHANNR
jgi:hypothetical protein